MRPMQNELGPGGASASRIPIERTQVAGEQTAMAVMRSAARVVVCLAFAAICQQALADPVHINCEGGKKECEGSYDIANMGTKRFLGRCQPKRYVYPECNLNQEGTTIPKDQKCASGGSSSVTCTITAYACGSNSAASCDCTNWAFKRNKAKATVRCEGARTTLSDRRLKADIVRVGESVDGIPLYRFRYLWGETLYVGVMAQDVTNIVPEAVVRDASGYLSVDYSALGIRMTTWEEFRASDRQARDRSMNEPRLLQQQRGAISN